MITRLPPEFMIGAQLPEMIDAYRKKGGELDRMLLGKRKTLRQHIEAHLKPKDVNDGSDSVHNTYVMKKHFKYLNLTIAATHQFTPPQIDQILSATLIR